LRGTRPGHPRRRLRHGRHGPVPQDPAWHIAHRPGWLIALVIQHGHMRTILDARTSSGYASRSERGIHGVLDVETALAAADTVTRLEDRRADGERISGPGAVVGIVDADRDVGPAA
jgi:hypothetical protein